MKRPSLALFGSPLSSSLPPSSFLLCGAVVVWLMLGNVLHAGAFNCARGCLLRNSAPLQSPFALPSPQILGKWRAGKSGAQVAHESSAAGLPPKLRGREAKGGKGDTLHQSWPVIAEANLGPRYVQDTESPSTDNRRSTSSTRSSSCQRPRP